MRGVSIALTVLLATGKYALYGFTWQDLPAYLLLMPCIFPAIDTGRGLNWTGRICFGGLAAACVGAWILPAVPTLPPPQGRYAVGTQIYRWTDSSRDEPHTENPNDRRSVIAQAWYPAIRGETSGHSSGLAYIDGIGRLPNYVGVMPAFLLRRYDQIDTHAVALAPVAPRGVRWPVVIFSPGYGAPRAVYTGLATQLASRGFVVFVLDHPYEAAVTELPDGRVAVAREIVLPGDPDRIQYMVREQRRRTADVQFVIEQLAKPQALASPLRGSNIDFTKVAVIGHSFGGATAISALVEDPRIVAAVNIDGTPYGELPDRQITRPFLLLQSDFSETHHGELFRNGNGKLLANATAPTFRYEIEHANHYSFTDVPFFFAPHGRWLLAQFIGGGRGPMATQRATADILSAFLTGPLTNTAAKLSATAVHYPGVRGGKVEGKFGI
ncbi:MAG: hypothetical protein EOP14_04200 [Pseudomonas sp.]|nr:MAG: hypothetical protein EOP14_04200 [Pseudomonas sp.]